MIRKASMRCGDVGSVYIRSNLGELMGSNFWYIRNLKETFGCYWLPIGSMYSIVTFTFTIKKHAVMSCRYINIPYMDDLGYQQVN